jgi:hypothetical protein
MKKSWVESSPIRALDQAYQEISELGDEMREAFEATPEQFKNSIGVARENAADILEAVQRPPIPVSIDGDQHEISWLEMRRGKDGKLTRSARRDNVVRCLKAVLVYASQMSDESREMVTFLKDLEVDIHNLETIDFPGMSGR